MGSPNYIFSYMYNNMGLLEHLPLATIYTKLYIYTVSYDLLLIFLLPGAVFIGSVIGIVFVMQIFLTRSIILIIVLIDVICCVSTQKSHI